MIRDSRLEPGPRPAGRVEHRGVRHLQLCDGEPPVEPGPAIIDGEGVRHHRHHAPQQVPDVPRAEAGADASGHGGVGDRAQAVVEGLEADTRLGQLALGPLVPVGTGPQGIGRVPADLQEGWPPLGIPPIQVPVVGHRRHPTPAEVGVTRAMGGVGVVHEPTPRRGPLLGLAHQHQPGTARRSGRLLIGAGDVLLHSFRRNRTTGTSEAATKSSSSEVSRSWLW